MKYLVRYIAYEMNIFPFRTNNSNDKKKHKQLYRITSGKILIIINKANKNIIIRET